MQAIKGTIRAVLKVLAFCIIMSVPGTAVFVIASWSHIHVSSHTQVRFDVGDELPSDNVEAAAHEVGSSALNQPLDAGAAKSKKHADRSPASVPPTKPAVPGQG